MRWVRLGHALLSIGLLLGCDDASNAEPGAGAVRGRDGGPRADAGGAGETCGPFATPGCAPGLTCCWSGASGTCRELSACKSDVQLECHSAHDCNSSEVCCATFRPWFNSASDSEQDGGPSDVTATSFCERSCSAPNVALCRTSAECASGTKCSVPPEGQNPPLLAIAAEALLVCAADTGSATARLPLVRVKDVELPGAATRFDYQDIDAALGHLVVAHMNDNSVLIIDLVDGSVLEEIKNIKTARGIAVADDAGIIFVTSTPNKLVRIDNKTLMEIDRVDTGTAPDGVGWDPADKVVGVSDQGDGALSLIADAGKGKRTQVPLGIETGNVVFDAGRGWFWITVVAAKPPDQLIAVDPVSAKIEAKIDLPGCSGAHGLRLHPDGQSAFIACESNSTLARVALGADHAIDTATTGAVPDVMSIDPGLGWLYVAAEAGELTVFDIDRGGVALIGHDQPGDNAHSVAVDPATHRVFFPLMSGPKGKPVLRIMQPSGI